LGTLMPFIVTTSRPAAYRSIGPPTIYRISRQAVATLPDAQRLLRAAVRDADWPRDVGGSNARQSVSGQIDDLMASGGNAIRLPDGTVIEVVAVDDAEYARAIDAGMNGPAVPGVAEPDPAPIRGRWMIRVCQHGHRVEYRENYGGWLHMDAGDTAVCDSADVARVVPVPDEAAIERGALAVERALAVGSSHRHVAEAVLRAALEPPA
jgi:hypothetical protein